MYQNDDSNYDNDGQFGIAKSHLCCKSNEVSSMNVRQSRICSDIGSNIGKLTERKGTSNLLSVTVHEIN